jgi:hypothetical protein
MTCNPRQSERDVTGDTASDMDDRQSVARLMQQSDVPELFDEAAKRRFGQWISGARTKPRKRS